MIVFNSFRKARSTLGLDFFFSRYVRERIVNARPLNATFALSTQRPDSAPVQSTKTIGRFNDCISKFATAA